jgi:Xaa-Pro dipeptidase
VPRPRVLGVPGGTVTDGLCVSTEIILGPVGSMMQITEPFIAGRVGPQQRAEFDLNLAAFEAARTALVPGTTWRAVRKAVLDVAAGTEYSMCFLLHSGYDGPLFVPNEVPEAVLDDTVEEGSVFICKPTAWPASTGRFNARSHDTSWGDMLVVRKNGAERLGTRPQQLHSTE